MNVAFFSDNPQKSSLFHLLRALFLLHLDEFGFHCDCMRLVTFLKKTKQKFNTKIKLKEFSTSK